MICENKILLDLTIFKNPYISHARPKGKSEIHFGVLEYEISNLRRNLILEYHLLYFSSHNRTEHEGDCMIGMVGRDVNDTHFKDRVKGNSFLACY